MTRSHKVLGFLLVAVLGIYGCARGPSGPAGGGDATLQAKVQRLEEDYKAAAAARDSFRQKLLAAEEQQGRLRQQAESERAAAVQERDALAAQLKARTAERDHFQTQYGNFIRTIREQIDKAESAMANPADPTVAGTQITPAVISGTAN